MDWFFPMFLPVYQPQFPYIKFVEKKRNAPNEYVKITEGNDKTKPLHPELLALVKKNRDLLLLNQVPVNKIYFVFSPMFTYCLDDNTVNPKYEIFAPLRDDGSGLFDNTKPIIEVNKPSNIVSVCVNCYRVEDNYAFIKAMAKKSKRGIAIFVCEDEEVLSLLGKHIYRACVDDEFLRLINLDDVVEQHNYVPADSVVV
jgi:hypothetical protein